MSRPAAIALFMMIQVAAYVTGMFLVAREPAGANLLIFVASLAAGACALVLLVQELLQRRVLR